MKMADKLRSAAIRPQNWDMDGLLHDAANLIDELVQACKAAKDGERAADLVCEIAIEKAESHK